MAQNIAAFNPSKLSPLPMLGSKTIKISKTVSGILFGTGSQTYNTQSALTPSDTGSDGKVKIKIAKTMGTGKATIKIFTKDGTRPKRLVETITFSKGSNNIEQVVTKLLPNATFKSLIIHVDGKSVADKFGYKLTIQR